MKQNTFSTSGSSVGTEATKLLSEKILFHGHSPHALSLLPAFPMISNDSKVADPLYPDANISAMS